MKNVAKKGFALLLTLALVFGTVPGFALTALAAETTVTSYTGLQAETSASGTADIVKLDQNINGAAQLDIERSLTLDLNGQDLTIDVSSGSGIKLANGVTLTITDNAPGSNKLTVTNSSTSLNSGGGAGINTAAGKLIIDSGTVEVTGGVGGAGIGGGYNGSGGTICIDGGEIIAQGNGGAGIGGGSGSGGGIITINNGKITATGGGAGIGGGHLGAGGTITVNNGEITAQGGVYGAGIGGGNLGSGGTITINNGEINTTGGESSAGIGGGSGGGGGTITINNGKIIAAGGNNGAGIGSGSGSSGGTIAINGGETTAQGGYCGAGIGGGDLGEGGAIAIRSGKITARGGYWGAGIGGGNFAYGGAIAISGGEITASGDMAAGIGGGGGHAGSGGVIAISGGTVSAVGGNGAMGIDGTATISGGSIKANSISSQPSNGSVPVYLTTLTVGNGADGTALIAAGYGAGGSITANYGVKDVVTREVGKVYFYLPEADYAAGGIAVAALAGAKYDNSAAINVTTGGTAAGSLDNSSSKRVYTITFDVQDRNGDPWNNHGRSLSCPTASLQNAATARVTITSFLSDPFAIYDGAAYTGRTLSTESRPLVYYTTDARDFTLSNNTVTYDGTRKSVTVSPQNGVGTVTVYYTGTGGTSYGKSTTAPANVGTYTVTVDAAEGAWNGGILYFAATGLNIGTLTIGKASGGSVGVPAVSGSPTTDTVTVSAVTNAGGTGQTVEYAISESDSTALNSLTWEVGKTTFTGLNPATTYYVYARTKENDNYYAGAAQVSAGITTAVQTYSLSVSAGANGSVIGTSSGSYAAGTPITVTAIADIYCHFKDWTATSVSLADTAANPVTFSMPANTVTLTANFEADAPAVTNVTVTPAAIAVQKGTSQQFAAAVHGTNNPSQTVNWTIDESGLAAATGINGSGLLTVDASETAAALTIRATSTVDAAKFGTATVTVTDATLTPGALTGTAVIDRTAPRIGDTLTGSLVGGNNTGTLTIVWKAGDTSAGTGADYTVKTADLGKTITIEITSSAETGTLTSSPTAAVVKKPAPYAPSAPTGASKTHDSVTLTANALYEFSKDGLNWQMSNVFSGLNPNTEYTFYRRICETPDTEASLPSPALNERTNAAPPLTIGFTITFNANGGTVSPAAMLTGADGRLTTLPTPTMSGYRFDGWFTAASGGTEITVATIFSANAAIYAHWTKIDNSGGDGSGSGGSGGDGPGSGGSGGDGSGSGGSGGDGSGSGGSGGGGQGSGGSGNSGSGNGTIPSAPAPSPTDSENKATQPTGIGGGQTGISGSNGIDGSTGMDGYSKFTSQSIPFTDVHEGDWYYDDVVYAYAHGLFSGTTGTLFSPNESLTRGMIVTVLYRLAGEPDVSGGAAFDDIDANAYYAKAVAWAKANDIVRGVSGALFAPDLPITRQDLAVILQRYAVVAGLKLPVTRDYPGFNDAADIADYAKEAIEVFFKAGVVNGKPGNVFDTKGTATRAEAAAMLRRFIEGSARQ